MKVKIYLDYRCYPIWTYDSNGGLVDNDLPKELQEDKELDDIFMSIQSTYDKLFIDNAVEFRYVGFSNDTLKNEFLKTIDDAIKMLSSRLGEEFVIEDKLSL